MTKSHGLRELSPQELDAVFGGTTGGIVISHGGGNANVSNRPLSEADVTTVGGIAFGRGRSVTNGGMNTNIAAGGGGK